jgi:hypothetical protein
VFEVGNKRGRFKAAETLEEILERSVGKAFATRKRIRNIVSRMSFPRIDDTITPEQFVVGGRSDLAADRSYKMPSGLLSAICCRTLVCRNTGISTY